MCEDRTTRPDEAYARVIDPCPTFYEHLLSDHVSPSSTPDRPVTQQTFRAFGDVSLIIVELGYFDVDFRSEFSAVLEDSFAVEDHSTARLHFFRGTEKVTRRTDLRACLEAAVATEVPDPDRSDPVEGARALSPYLGYVIIRPQSPGTIGRSVIAPAEKRPDLSSQTRLEAHVRTAIREPVDIFGVRAQAFGVPFMEQDRRLLRCAHVDAWMCHYTAVLRGMAARRRTAEFNVVGGAQAGIGRPYPAEGLTDLALADVFRSIGFPAEQFTVRLLTKPRPPLWTDRPALFDLASASEKPSRDDLKLWLRENLSATACRYLNSGLPLVLAENYRRHARVVCGYVREEDLEDGDAGRDAAHSDVAAFLVNDDMRGPYQLCQLTELVDQVFPDGIQEAHTRAFSLLAPLPRGLWLSGARAEAVGVKALAGSCDELASFLAAKGRTLPDGVARMRDFIHTRKAGDRTPSGGYAVRSFALTGTDFKRSFEDVMEDQRAARIIGKIQLPKYVWIVEVLDRDLRPGPHDAPRAAVVATAVVDASAVERGEVGAVPILAVHLPGYMFTPQAGWKVTTVRPRFTCRWNNLNTWLTSPEASAERGKEA